MNVRRKIKWGDRIAGLSGAAARPTLPAVNQELLPMESCEPPAPKAFGVGSARDRAGGSAARTFAAFFAAGLALASGCRPGVVRNEQQMATMERAIKNEDLGTVIALRNRGYDLSDAPTKINPDNRFSRIILKVEKGDGILVNRSTQAMRVESERPVIFQKGD